MYLPAPCFGRTGMSRHLFEYVLKGITFRTTINNKDSYLTHSIYEHTSMIFCFSSPTTVAHTLFLPKQYSSISILADGMVMAALGSTKVFLIMFISSASTIPDAKFKFGMRQVRNHTAFRSYEVLWWYNTAQKLSKAENAIYMLFLPF